MNEFISKEQAIKNAGGKERFRYFYQAGLIRKENGLYSSEDCITAPFRHRTNVECGRAAGVLQLTLIPDRVWLPFLAWRLKT